MVLFWIVSLIRSVLKDGYETLTFYVFYMYVVSNLVAYVQVKPLTFTYPLNCFQTPKKPPKKCVNRPAGFFPELGSYHVLVLGKEDFLTAAIYFGVGRCHWRLGCWPNKLFRRIYTYVYVVEEVYSELKGEFTFLRWSSTPLTQILWGKAQEAF